MFKRGEVVFAKVKGHSPWPAKILKRDSPTQFKVFFFGTKQEGVVKESQVWDYEEYVETFSSRYGSRQLYALALKEANKTKMKTQAKEKQKEAYKTKELVFAKVKGYSPWPAQIVSKHAPNIYNVFFFGTSETGKVKKENIWNYNAKREDFAAKYGKRKPYALALKQIGEVASLASSKSTKKNAPVSSATVRGSKSVKETVAMFVDDENIPNTSDNNRMATEENITTMLVDDEVSNMNLKDDEDIGKPVDDEVDKLVPTVSNMNLEDDEEVGKPIQMIEDEMLGLKDSSGKELEKGNSVRMLRDRNQFEMIPELSRKNEVKVKLQKNHNIQKGNAEENNIKKENSNNNDKKCAKEFNPKKVEDSNQRSVAMLNTRTNQMNMNETEEIEEIQYHYNLSCRLLMLQIIEK